MKREKITYLMLLLLLVFCSSELSERRSRSKTNTNERTARPLRASATRHLSLVTRSLTHTAAGSTWHLRAGTSTRSWSGGVRGGGTEDAVYQNVACL